MSNTNITNRNKDGLQREQRYRVCDPKLVRVLVERHTDHDADQIEGSLNDLSQSGVKMFVPGCLPVSEAIAVTFSIADLDLEISVNAEACWTRPASDETWLMGCSFNPRLNETMLCRLATTGLIERREKERLPAAVSLMAYRESDAEPQQIHLVDYSTKGFSISGRKACQVGQRLRINVPTSDGQQTTVMGIVQWDLFTTGQHAVGCLTRPSSVDVLRQCNEKYQKELHIKREAAIQARKENLRT